MMNEHTTEDATETKGNREAAKYRRELREVQHQLEATQTALSAARTQILRTALTDHRVERDTFNIEAIDDAGLDAGMFFGEDGNLNNDALDTAMRELHQAKPYFFTAPQKLIIPNEGGSADARTDSSWREAFAPN